MNDVWNSKGLDWGNYFTGDGAYYQGELVTSYLTAGTVLLSMGLLFWLVWRK